MITKGGPAFEEWPMLEVQTMTIKLIGAGFGRTGTTSIKAALEELGFGQCYHMSEVLTHPAHVAVWSAALAGQPPDWPAFFTGSAH